jgi:aspartyl-tRNA(Asn)/glutamyl-tRNA(Gln) amidotransferase subunit C
MAITRETVLHVAKLANLNLDPSEVERMQCDLEKIVHYIDQLAELDTTNVEPTAHLAVHQAPRVPDKAHESLPTERALSQGPRVHDNGFAVPAFVDEG